MALEIVRSDHHLFDLVFASFVDSTLKGVCFPKDPPAWRDTVRASLNQIRYVLQSGVSLTKAQVTLIKVEVRKWCVHVISHTDNPQIASIFESELKMKSEQTRFDPAMREAMATARLRAISTTGASRVVEQLSLTGELPGGAHFDAPETGLSGGGRRRRAGKQPKKVPAAGQPPGAAGQH